MELLAAHGEGVIALSGCLASRARRRIVEGRLEEARAHLDELVQVFGPENVYFEIQHNGVAEQEQVNEAMSRFGKEMGRPLVATADVHYLRREDYHHHAALLCVQTKSTLAAPKMSFDTNEFYLKSSEEMAESFADVPEALASTLEIAERCDVAIELGGQLIPRFDSPDGKTERDYLRALVRRGLRQRYGDPMPAEALERAEMELGVIDKMGFNAYFLIVWDFVDYAKDNGIAVGPGRGSAAGSIVAYCLPITDVDPLRYDLLFERFLNAERVSMPDIDIDFSVRGRERVIRYVTEKYGAERVAQIITFGKMFPRAATRDAARVLGHEYAIGDRLAKLIPDPQQGRPPSFEDCLQPGAELAAEVARDPIAKQIVDVAQGLEGIVRNASIHAAAVVIADRPLTDIVPLQLADAGAGENGAEDLPHGHAVLDEADRGDRPAQDGLPRPAQPRRDRGRAGHRRALDRRAAGHDDAAARRREDLRDDGPGRLGRACSSSSPRACARRSRRSTRRSSRTSSRSSRSTARAPWTRSPTYARGKRNPDSIHLHRRPPAPDHRGRRRA